MKNSDLRRALDISLSLECLKERRVNLVKSEDFYDRFGQPVVNFQDCPITVDFKVMLDLFDRQIAVYEEMLNDLGVSTEEEKDVESA